MTAFLPKFLGRVALVTTVACTPFLAAAQSPDSGLRRHRIYRVMAVARVLCGRR